MKSRVLYCIFEYSYEERIISLLAEVLEILYSFSVFTERLGKAEREILIKNSNHLRYFNIPSKSSLFIYKKKKIFKFLPLLPAKISDHPALMFEVQQTSSKKRTSFKESLSKVNISIFKIKTTDPVTKQIFSTRDASKDVRIRVSRTERIFVRRRDETFSFKTRPSGIRFF